MATKLQLEATEKYNLICRQKEEELLLVKEMTSYISFHQHIISELKDAIKGIINYGCTFAITKCCA